MSSKKPCPEGYPNLEGQNAEYQRARRKPWNIKEGVYEYVVPDPHTQKISDLRKKGLETPSTQE